MAHSSINWLAVIMAMIAQMVVGFVWFSPALFFQKWLDANQLQAPRKPEAWIFIVMVILTFISTTALAAILRNIGSRTAFAGIIAAGFIWTATLMPFIAGTTLSTGRKYSLIALEYGHTIIGLLIAGAILAAWH
ncbi:MAG TPA: DUF1761 domain-containing protein [Patescibacteria group bacterium]